LSYSTTTVPRPSSNIISECPRDFARRVDGARAAIGPPSESPSTHANNLSERQPAGRKRRISVAPRVSYPRPSGTFSPAGRRHT
jgi:hypothetical protein